MSILSIQRVHQCALALAVFLLAGPTVDAAEPRLAIKGYDPVAYFTPGEPMQGSADIYLEAAAWVPKVGPGIWANILALYLGAVPALSPEFPHLGWAHGPFSPAGTTLLWPPIGATTSGYVASLGVYVELPLMCLWLLAPLSVGVVLVRAGAGNELALPREDAIDLLWTLSDFEIYDALAESREPAAVTELLTGVALRSLFARSEPTSPTARARDDT